MKFCKDCKFLDTSNGLCSVKRRVVGHDMVWGSPFYEGELVMARVLRSGRGPTDCGPHATHFQARIEDL